MGNVKSKVNTDEVDKEVKSHPVVMYTKAGCGYCAMAKELLNKESIEFKECYLDEIRAQRPDEYQAFANGLVYTTKMTTVPQIFICGQVIGGYTELTKLNEAKQLLAKIEECAQSY